MSGPGAPGPAADVLIRPMRADDVPAGYAMADDALREAGRRYGWHTQPADARSRAAGERRHAHLQRTDPDGAWVAELQGRVVGVAFALVRGPFWYLSLLAVAGDVQGRGVGGRLLDRALQTAEPCPAAMIMSSADPKALRRYGSAGFALLPGLEASGPVDRALLPAAAGVRDGDWDTDGERVDDLGRRLRGAPYGPDLAAMRDSGHRLLVADGGFAVLRETGLVQLGAADPATAQQLLWAALAEGPDEADLFPITADQQWCVQVALRARLQLRPGTSLCTRGAVGPLAPYLPSGAYG
jgi:GNAT superfamily N-acetyltransferase